MRRLAAAAGCLLVAAAGAARAGGPDHVAIGPTTWAAAERPDAASPPSDLVLVLPDALGGDPRIEPYVGALVARGFAAIAPQWQEVPPADQEAGARALIAGLPGLAAAMGAPPAAVGVLGFGLGARVALAEAAPRGVPVVALYPGCDGFPARPAGAIAGPVLLLHGSADDAEPAGACAALAARLGLRTQRHEYFGATYGWDYVPGPWPNMVSLLPPPDGHGPWRRANAVPAVTADAAARAAAFLARHLAGEARLAGGRGGGGEAR